MSGGRRGAVVLAGVVVLAGCAGTDLFSQEGGGRSDVEILAEPTPEPRPAEAGDAVDVRPLSPDVVPAGATGWQISYVSVGVHGQPVEVNGVVFAPDSPPPPEGRPVVSWGHGGNDGVGLADQCAPTRNTAVTVPFADELIEAGFVVAATDYEGLGKDGVHPYLVGTSSARSVIDAARAARDVPGAGANDEVLLFGHVGGGQAAAVGGTMFDEYAPDLTLLGVVAGAPPLELRPMMTATATLPPYFGHFAMAVKGYAYAYDDLDPSDLLTAEGVETLSVVDTSCLRDVLPVYADRDVGELVAVMPHEHERWSARFAENEPGEKPIPAPVLIVHGDADTNVLSVMSEIAARNMCKGGNTVDLRIVPGANQVTVLDRTKDDILGWMADRSEGAPADSTC